MIAFCVPNESLIILALDTMLQYISLHVSPYAQSFKNFPNNFVGKQPKQPPQNTLPLMPKRTLLIIIINSSHELTVHTKMFSENLTDAERNITND